MCSMRRHVRLWFCTLAPATLRDDRCRDVPKATPHIQNALCRAIALQPRRGGRCWIYETCSESHSASTLVGRYFWGSVRKKEGKTSSSACKAARPPRTISNFVDLAHRKTRDGFEGHRRVPYDLSDPSLALGSRSTSSAMVGVRDP